MADPNGRARASITPAPGAQPTIARVQATTTPIFRNDEDNIANPQLPVSESTASDDVLAEPEVARATVAHAPDTNPSGTQASGPPLARPRVENIPAASPSGGNSPNGAAIPQSPRSSLLIGARPDDSPTIDSIDRGSPPKESKEGSIYQDTDPAKADNATPEPEQGGSRATTDDDEERLPYVEDRPIQTELGDGFDSPPLPGSYAIQAGASSYSGNNRVIAEDRTPPSSGGVADLLPVVMAKPAPPDPVIIGKITADRVPDGVAIAGSTYTPGSQPQIPGLDVSIGTDNIVVDGTTHALPPQAISTPLLIGGQMIAKAPNGALAIGSTTYSRGAATEISGTAISIGSNDVIVAGSTYTLPTSPPRNSPPLAESPIAKAPNGGIIIGTSTISAGHQAIISGHTISAAASAVMIDGSAYVLHGAPSVEGGNYGDSDAPAVSADGDALGADGDVAVVSNGLSFLPWSYTKQGFITSPTGIPLDRNGVLFENPTNAPSITIPSIEPSNPQTQPSTRTHSQAETTTRTDDTDISSPNDGKGAAKSSSVDEGGSSRLGLDVRIALLSVFGIAISTGEFFL